MNHKNWYQKGYRRILLDYHIADWDPKFLDRFDPKEFAHYVKLANANAATVFANTHTGLCNYPSKVGQVHSHWKGRDGLKEMIDALHKQGISAMVYYCTIYCDWYWEEHPEARIVDVNGKSEKLEMNSAGHPRRFSVSCPNNLTYRQFVVDQLNEICDTYEFEGVWPDMTFWPTVCYCPACQERYHREVGGEIPRVVDWQDPIWVNFHHKRQEWMQDFIHLVSSTIKAKKPEVTVAHQSLTFCYDWMLGPNTEMAAESDWLSADLYGGRYEVSFYAKLFYGLSKEKPFEHINSWCYPNIHEHVITRTEDQLRMNAFSSFANQGAMVFIDAINPDGTIHKNNYKTVGKIFRDLERYEPFAGGKVCQDVGIYYSFDSLFNLEHNQRPVVDFVEGASLIKGNPSPTAHRQAVLNLAKTLIQHHIPFGAVTRKDLSRLNDYQVIMLPNAPILRQDELDALRAYVRDGGSLIVSKNSSLISYDGVRQPNFLLSDVLGVSYVRDLRELLTYVNPEEKWGHLFPGFSKEIPVTLNDSQLVVQPRAGTETLATITLPYTDPKSTLYASILTDPPGKPTEYPAIVMNHFGKGKTLYFAGTFESWEHDSQRQVLINLINMLTHYPLAFTVNAPKAIEVTLFQQDEQKRMVFNILNVQPELPNIPVSGIKVRLWLDHKKPVCLVALPDKKPVHFNVDGEYVTFTVPKIHDFSMFALEYS